MIADCCLLLAAYLIGAIPFGYLIGRMRGVDLFQVGSGNIGATNAGRVLGRKYGLMVFVLDFLKGAVPVAVIGPLAKSVGGTAAFGSVEVLRVGAAALAFLGHLFPIYLGFRGGKGVATGAGTILVLLPVPAGCAIGGWIAVTLATRYVALASLAAVAILVITRLGLEPAPFAPASLPATLYALLGSLLVLVKHRANVRRLLAGTESQIGDFPMRERLVRGLHLLALGLWFGGAGFFNFVAAPKIFASFDAVAKNSPSDRTAHFDITKGMEEPQKEQLGKALAGSAVGPIFPAYFGLQLGCCAVALATSFSWWKQPGRVNRMRVWILAAALVLVAISIPVGNHVSELRLLRFDVDTTIAERARADFGPWHLVSLLLSFITVLLAGIGLMLAAALPDRTQASTATP